MEGNTARELAENLDALSVLNLGAMDLGIKHQALGVYQEVSLTTFDLLGSVLSPLLAAYAGCLDRLAVYYRGAGLGVSLCAHPHSFA